jgi:hypothetical protein
MLTAADRERFEETGVLRLAGAFSPTEAAAMQQLIWEDTRRTRLAFLASHPWWQDLTARNRRDDGIARFVDTEERIGDVPVRVAELTGDAGDVVLTHPWVLHCRGVNCAAAPRFMRGQDIYRRSVALDLGMVPTPRHAAGSRRS